MKRKRAIPGTAITVQGRSACRSAGQSPFTGRVVALGSVLLAWVIASCAPETHAATLQGSGPNALDGRSSGKTVVITGASSGFGKGVARELAAQGANLVLAARRTNFIEELARECGPRTIAVTTDVTKEADVERLARTAIARFGRIDVWINDAGTGALGRFEDIPLRDHERIVQTNLLGVIYGSHFALRQFRLQRSGILINLGSIAGKISLPYYNTYAATKFAVVGLDAALRQELKRDGLKNIHVCTVLPMPNDTPFFQHAANYTGHTLRAAPMYDPQHVVDAIVKLTDRPKDEVAPSFVGKASLVMNTFAPGLTEDTFGSVTQKSLQAGSPAPATAGSLYRPMAEGAEVQGGVRERMAAEDRQARQDHDASRSKRSIAAPVSQAPVAQ